VSLLQLNRISKTFDHTRALADISLTLDKGQILCLLGPSGCGKTTLLRVIAGLERPDRGQLRFDGQDISGVPPHQRDFGLMFQEFALFPHKNVTQNVAFGLQMKSQGDIDSRVEAMLELVGLAGFGTRDVSSLSGGERQRVALARSLAPNPRLLMLDEPLGALDRALRERLMLEIRQILKKIGLTAIYVTHDQMEAFAVADRVVVINKGQLEQEATPEQLYRRPATPFVANFLGFHNLLNATVRAGNRLETKLGSWAMSVPHTPDQPVVALIRPEAASLSPVEGGISLNGQVTGILFRGRFYQITLQVGDQQLRFEISFTGERPAPDSTITVWLNPKAIMLLPKPPSNQNSHSKRPQNSEQGDP